MKTVREKPDLSPRPTEDEYLMALARSASARSTCIHRKQGAVIAKEGRVISAGYNGSPPNMKHCTDFGCVKDAGGPCRAEGLHGESNAVVSAARLGISVDGASVYCIYSPCRSCCNILKTAGIAEVKYTNLYDGFPEGPEYLKELDIRAEKMEV